MVEEREMYKGREIVVKKEEGRISALAEEGTEEQKPELYIDGKHIDTMREPSGVHRAVNYAYAPTHSLKDLAKKLIDYEEEISGGR